MDDLQEAIIKALKSEEISLFRAAEFRKEMRGCLATFMPYIKTTIYILLTAATLVIGLLTYSLQKADEKLDQYISLATENKAILASWIPEMKDMKEKVERINREVFGK